MNKEILNTSIKNLLIEQIQNKKLPPYINFLQATLFIYSLIYGYPIGLNCFIYSTDAQNFSEQNPDINENYLHEIIEHLENLSTTKQISTYIKSDDEYKECNFKPQKAKLTLQDLMFKYEEYSMPIPYLKRLVELEKISQYTFYYNLYQLYELFSHSHSKKFCFANGFTTISLQIIADFTDSKYLQEWVNEDGTLKNYETIFHNFLKDIYPNLTVPDILQKAMVQVLLPGLERKGNRTPAGFYKKQMRNFKK